MDCVKPFLCWLQISDGSYIYINFELLITYLTQTHLVDRERLRRFLNLHIIIWSRPPLRCGHRAVKPIVPLNILYVISLSSCRVIKLLVSFWNMSLILIPYYVETRKDMNWHTLIFLASLIRLSVCVSACNKYAF